ncbi:MAG TPA: SLATT domain-containing protein [Pyrinomonadaceae bacterium]|nr:SLATT domain-containing protein [Pyrinomonadaceae bacterium]
MNDIATGDTIKEKTLTHVKHEKRAGDIDTPGLQVHKLKWKTDHEIQASIGELYQYAEENASKSIAWYGKQKRKKAVMSRILRGMAIIFTIAGGLTPIIAALGLQSIGSPPGRQVQVGQLGYLLLGLAAACVGFDKFFGFSSGWMRYLGAKMLIERALSEFRLDWAMMVAKLRENSPTTDQVQLMIQRVKEFLLTVNNHVEQETQAWVSEFRTNLAEIEKSAKEQGESSRPGAIDITVTNGMDTKGGFTVTLDGMEVKTMLRGTKYQIGYVAPGPHRIAVSGEIKNEMLDASELVNVAPGEIAKVTLALPVTEAQP